MALYANPGVLPDFVEFAEPDINFYPALEDIESSSLATTGSGVDIEPYGMDIGFDIITGDLSLTPSGDLRIVNENAALTQYVAVVLSSNPGADLIYSSDFGAGLSALIGQDLPDQALQTQIKRQITEAILQHERIEEVRSFTFENIDDLLVISFSVVKDDSSELVFEGLQLGR